MPIYTKAQFERKKLDKSKNHSGYLMVSLAASDEKFLRTPASFVLVLDVSGSMADVVKEGSNPFIINMPRPKPSSPWVKPPDPWINSQWSIYGCNKWPEPEPEPEVSYTYGSYVPPKRKIDIMKETAIKFVDNLSDKDEIGIITFDSGVTVLAERQNAKNKASIKEKINSLQPGSSTNMSGGLLAAVQMMNAKFEGVRRLVLLTDGIPNVGVSDPKQLQDLVAQTTIDPTTKKPFCSLSTFGFGLDCNRELLANMAQSGRGNYYFVADDEDLSNTFAKELGGTLGCMAQNIEVKITPNRGVKIESILNNFSTDYKDDSIIVRAEDIYVSENKHLLFKLSIDKVSKPKPRPVSIAHIEVSFDDIKNKKREVVKLNPKATYVKASQADAEPVLEVAEQVAILEAAKAQKEAVKLANIGDFIGAGNVLRSASFGLNKMADMGSQIATCASVMYSSTMDSFTEDNYNMSIGATVDASADSTMKHRAGTKGLSDVYLTKSVEDMVEKFKDTPEDKK